jgi:hypothetical protein
MVQTNSYYPTQADALAGTNYITGSSNVVISAGGHNFWHIASNSTGTSPQSAIYGVGSALINDGIYRLYPAAACFKEGTQILCLMNGKETYQSIETVKPGTLVKTSLDGYKPVALIASGSLQNLYRCSPREYPELTEDLYITGHHAILVDQLTSHERSQTSKILGRIFVTDRKYRLLACVDTRAQPWNSAGSYTIWHLALEHADPNMNYGIYANGLLVESCPINTLKNRSNLR